jgi:hypothetical protein
MQKFKIYITFFFTTIIISCGNNEKIDSSKLETISETDKIKTEKIKLSNSADSLTQEVDSLQQKKNLLSENNKAAEAELYAIIKNSYLDYVIFGTKNLKSQSDLFTQFGFTIKNGKLNSNGIKNNFIEFSDDSKIEFIEVNNPTDKISNEYNDLIRQNKKGLQFAFRVVEIETLKNNFEKLNYPFTQMGNNNIYSTLSSKQINTQLPLFFIQFSTKKNNSTTDHKNNSKGIRAVWFSTSDIKKTARELVNFGFEAIGNYVIPTFNKKIVQFRNTNFEIILIDSDMYEISGITISVKNISFVKNILEKIKDIHFIEQSVNLQKSIFLNPSQTKCIWIEFTEPVN